jgi:L-lactate dehydrogenase
VHSAGPQVVNLKGYTSCGIASAAIAIARAILFNENRVIPVCTNLDGHFGFHDVFTSVPAIIDSDGVREIIDLHLTDEEMRSFENTVRTIKAQDAEATNFM